MKIDRLIGIISVLQQKEKVTAPYLAEKFEVSRRTINRDIEDLCKAGIPIVTLQGVGGGITVADGYKIDKALLTLNELNAIVVGLQSLESVSKASNYRQIIDKLSGEGKRICPEQNSISIDLSSHYKNSLAPKIELLQRAISERRIISFDYYYNKGESRKVVEPYTIVFKWTAWYLFGFSEEKQDFRLFKLNRLWDLELTIENYEPREVPADKRDLDGHFTDSFYLEAVFDPEVKYRLIEEYGPDSFTENERGQLLFKYSFTYKDSMIEWILSFGDKAEVIKPDETRKEIHERLKKSLDKYKHDI